MIHALIAVGAGALLFVLYGLTQQGRQRPTCHGCSCHGTICERTGEPHHIELVE